MNPKQKKEQDEKSSPKAHQKTKETTHNNKEEEQRPLDDLEQQKTKENKVTYTPVVAKQPTSLPAILAGFVKATFMKSLFTLSIWTKGFLSWWFRFPIKLFRPHTVSPYFMISVMAKNEGKPVSFKFMRGVLSDEGFQFIRKNMLPLLIVNGMAGALLFNVYGISHYTLQKKDQGFKYYHPFLCGALSGGIHSVVATPIDNITNSIPARNFLERKDKGMVKVTLEAINKVLPKDQQGIWKKYKFLFRDWTFICIKDSIGFMTFFGVFESTRKILMETILIPMFNKPYQHDHDSSSSSSLSIFNLSKSQINSSNKNNISSSDQSHPTRLNSEYHHQQQESSEKKRNSWSYTFTKTSCTLTAGALAGMAFQLTSYPIERLRTLHIKDYRLHRKTLQYHYDKINYRRMRATFQKHGIKTLYKGIGGFLIRTMPPSAVGLLVYELAMEY